MTTSRVSLNGPSVISGAPPSRGVIFVALVIGCSAPVATIRSPAATTASWNALWPAMPACHSSAVIASGSQFGSWMSRTYSSDIVVSSLRRNAAPLGRHPYDASQPSKSTARDNIFAEGEGQDSLMSISCRRSASIATRTFSSRPSGTRESTVSTLSALPPADVRAICMPAMLIRASPNSWP